MNITQPTFLIDEARTRQNIRNMAQKARASGVHLRPHFKTHQSDIVGAWFRDEGIESITVSSVSMAEMFVAYGWKDILIAFPLNWLEIDEYNQLAEKITLGILVESPESAHFLAQHLQHPANVWLEIDTGYHRTGVLWDDEQRFMEIANELNTCDNITIKGVLTHAGHSYQARTESAIQQVYNETVARLTAARDTLQAQGFDNIFVSIGDTPCCSILPDFPGVDEIRPGNFVYFDLMQLQIGSCTRVEISALVACPIVSKHHNNGFPQVVVYGGAIHLSKETISENGESIFGQAVRLHDDHWEWLNAPVISVSQEHGTLRMPEDIFDELQIGDILGIVPVHSCLTANLLLEHTKVI